eukprot:TRINITY_DN43052_c0_g1_i1.p1 TRINITY_DN43052_c0_g1~~TRINITY_DN43052_c0_g1_i1.p1  ORF type:complete len:621 (-),score=103.35 TRINITY_DN43052_c0_g1_i1:73-1935(-)
MPGSSRNSTERPQRNVGPDRLAQKDETKPRVTFSALQPKANDRTCDRVNKGLAGKCAIRSAGRSTDVNRLPSSLTTFGFSTAASEGELIDPIRSIAHRIQRNLAIQFPTLCSLLPLADHKPKVMKRLHLVRFIEEVYRALYAAEAKVLLRETTNERGTRADTSRASRVGASSSFPAFVFESAKKQYGMRQLVASNCWSIVSGVNQFRAVDTCIGTFANFLDESFHQMDVLFYVYVRHYVERFIASTMPAVPWATNTSGKKVPSCCGVCVGALQFREILCAALPAKKDLLDSIFHRLNIASTDSIVTPKAAEDAEEALSTDINLDHALAAAVDEYRDLRLTSEKIAADTRSRSTGHNSAQVEKSAAPPQEVPECLREEAVGIAENLITSMESMGQSVRQEEVENWALQISRRRLEFASSLERGHSDDDYTLRLDDRYEVCKAIPSGTESQPSAGLALASLDSKPSVPLPSEDEFEANLQGSVHTVLIMTTEEFAADMLWQEAAASSRHFSDTEMESIHMTFVDEAVVIVDLLMEALVTEDFDSWLNELDEEFRMDRSEQTRFGELLDHLRQVLDSDITAEPVWELCTAILISSSVHQRLRRRALEILNSRPVEDRESEHEV